VHLLSTFGIVALFLFAGLDVDATDLARRTKVLVQHLVIRVLLLALATEALTRWLDIALRAAVLVALALLTPSTGFILDSLHRFGLSAEERLWVRSKAIATRPPPPSTRRGCRRHRRNPRTPGL
jgi:Kef-type K+ transport system membrane component KefB